MTHRGGGQCTVSYTRDRQPSAHRKGRPGRRRPSS